MKQAKFPFFILLLVLPLLKVQAADFEAMLFPSPVQWDENAWFMRAENSDPEVPRIKEVVRGQLVSLPVFFRNFATDENNSVDITNDLEISDRRSGSRGLVAHGILGHKGSEQASGDLMGATEVHAVVFEDADKIGTYTVKVTAHDNVAGKIAIAEASIELRDFTCRRVPVRGGNTAMDVRLLPPSRTLKVISAIHEIVRFDPTWLNDNLFLLVFFGQVFKDNPFVIEHIAERFDAFSMDDKKRFLLISAVSGDSTLCSVVKNRNIELMEFYEMSKRLRFPSLEGGITSVEQVSMLWAQFMATGDYEPVEKIVSALSLGEYAGTLARIKSGEADDATSEVQRMASLELTYVWVVSSLARNCAQERLLLRHCMHYV